MEINDVRPDRTGPAWPVQAIRDAARQPHDQDLSDFRDDADRLDISDRARLLVDEGGEASPEGTLDPERVLELRRRIQARFHDQPDVAERVARRILERGDL